MSNSEKKVKNIIFKKNLVSLASNETNILACYPEFQTREILLDGEMQCLRISCFHRWDLDRSFIDWAYRLLEQSVQARFKTFGFRWSKVETRNELAKKRGHYLVVTDRRSVPIGFALYNFEVESGQAVLNCRWIALEERVRGQGLGSHLIKAMETIAKHSQMEAIMIALPRQDTLTMNLFIDLNYELDKRTVPGAMYVVLSKPTLPAEQEQDADGTTEPA
ncbi:N-alpha-acetyltransferase 40-like [Anopheles albimanus]|uniref:N-alpha-acetyltransferase 40 n=1 Tax=Anopheles albimanus TaxID=7167 RepID=A0A182F253_ANOAL|nr:N-alpha-acetyltransferase 40-like [Anopheles albimanus]